MSAGQYRNRVTIMVPAAGQDAAGQPLAGFADLVTVWADIRHPPGVESTKAGAEVATLRASIRVRYRTDLTAAMRVRHGSTVFEVKSVAPDTQRREFVDLVCEAYRG